MNALNQQLQETTVRLFCENVMQPLAPLVEGYVPDLDPVATAEGKAENCPDCGARVETIFDHVDGCPEKPHDAY